MLQTILLISVLRCILTQLCQHMHKFKIEVSVKVTSVSFVGT